MLFKYIRIGSSNIKVIFPESVVPFLDIDFYGFNGVELWACMMIVLLLVAALGIGGRLGMVLASLAVLAFEFPMSSGIKPYTTNNLFFIFIILSLSPSTCGYNWRDLLRGPSVTKNETVIDNWTLPLLMSLLPLVYFNTFVSKMINGGWGWLSGEAVQSILVERYLYTNNYLALWLSEMEAMCFMITWMTLVGELIFGLVVVSKIARVLFVPMALSFHVGIFLSLRINFILMFCAIYFIYIDYSWLYLKIKQNFFKRTVL